MAQAGAVEYRGNDDLGNATAIVMSMMRVVQAGDPPPVLPNDLHGVEHPG